MAEWITNIIQSLGYFGIGLLMFLENLFPPIPSELIMPLAGFTASQGKMSLVPAIAAGVIGTVLGSLPWFYLGKILGENRIKQWITLYGAWIGISTKEIDKSQQWFYRHGNKAVFFGRFIPGVRTLISLPAGFSNIPLPEFLIYTTLGTLGWTLLLTFAGYFLGQNYTLVENYLGPVSKIVLGLLVLVPIIWVIRRRRQLRQKRAENQNNVKREDKQ